MLFGGCERAETAVTLSFRQIGMNNFCNYVDCDGIGCMYRLHGVPYKVYLEVVV